MSDTDENIEDLSTDNEEKLNDEEIEEEEIYESSTFISKPRISNNGTIDEDILQFDFSYGFSVRKYFNLAMPDPNYLLFTAGNIIHIFNVETNAMKFRRTGLGGGIGNIRTNPNPEYNHIAVAENGNKYGAKPLVVLYEWPSLEILTVLKGGSTDSFTNLDYSPDGMLLVSQAGEPDYLITIFDWPNRTILLRAKSYINDVYRVKFSEKVPGHLSSAGVAHIKFWKMCNTFTGLKLKGEVGRFGKTEYSDIVGVLPMPDEKVVSGCAWGNLLVWEGGLIKVEVMRNNRKPLHEAQIVQIFYIEGELWTVSQDGHIKVWWYEKIDQADPPEEDRVVMLEPSYDFYTPNVMLMSVIKRYRNDPESFQYFAQDGNGGIWIIDCNTYETPEESKLLLRGHAGQAIDLTTSPHSNFFATIGFGGRFLLYNYLTKKIVFTFKFMEKGSCLLWLPTELIKSGDEIIIGFKDGTLRICILDLSGNMNLSIIQIIKPHSNDVKAITINPTNSVLVTGGGDSIIFVFKIKIVKECALLEPIGLINSPDIPTCIIWKPSFDFTVTVGCIHGWFFEVEVPDKPQSYTKKTYLLKVKPQIRKFISYKSQIRRFIEIEKIEERKAQKVEKKRKEMQKIKEENPGMEIDEETFLADSESTIKWDPLYMPETPCDIVWLQYTEKDTIWISMTGYDSGYIYEYKIDQVDDIPLNYKMIDDADDVEVNCYVYNYNKKYLIFAMQNGSIRINKVKKDFCDLSDYWTLSMHENLNGFIPKMKFSYDEKYFFSCGHDGNVFSYTFHPEFNDYKPLESILKPIARIRNVKDIPDGKGEELSLEQAMIKAENDRIMRVANENKKKYLDKIAELRERYSDIQERNFEIPEDQRIRKDHLEVDPRVTDALLDMMEKKVALVRRKMAFDLCKADYTLAQLRTYYLSRLDNFPLSLSGLIKDTTIECLREKRLTSILFNMHAFIEMRILEADIKNRGIERSVSKTKARVTRRKRARELEYFLLALTQSTLNMKLDAKFMRLLNKYRTRKTKWESRKEQWRDFMALQPKEGENHPDDVEALKYAENNIGDYKLKTSPDYKVTNPQMRETTLKKYRQILSTRRKQYNIRHKYSKKVYNLRNLKEEVRQNLLKLEERLNLINSEIPEVARRYHAPIPSLKECEHPEKQFQVIMRDEEAEFFEDEFYFPEEPTVPVEPSKTDQKEEKKKFVVDTKRDQVEIELYLGLFFDKSVDDFFKDADALKKNKSVCAYSLNSLKHVVEQGPTPWETELRAFRLNRRLFEQEEIIQEMEDKIEDFDEKLDHLNNEKADTLVDGFYCDLFMHKLHQELIILKDFESHEEVLQDKVNARLTNVVDMENTIRRAKYQIEAQNLAIDKNLGQQGSLNEQFTKLVHDNKFGDFLRKVFKKKYKPPKVKHGDESSSESSSSSSESDEEDDTKSIDSRDFGIIRQDLNVCPKGCEQEIFDNTIALRSERHQLEIALKERQRDIEAFKKELELNVKKLRIMNTTLQASQDELTSYQREKQQKLNEVECTVILNLDQLQHFAEPHELSPISECLLFSKTLLSKLYKRVGELQTETSRFKAKHLVNVKHLSRMRTDIKYMNNQIHNLKQQIIEEVTLKFGKIIRVEVIDNQLEKKTFGHDIINKLMESLLRKMVHDLRLSLIDVKSLYHNEIVLWENKLADAEIEYKEALRENTARLDLLGLLKKEKLELSIQIANQEKKREMVQKKKGTSEDINYELKKLRKILKIQDEQINDMKNEIKSLKSKTHYPPVKIDEEADDLSKKEAMEDIEHVKDYLYPIASDEFVEVIEKIPSKTDMSKHIIVKSILQEFTENLDAKLDAISLDKFVKRTTESLLDRVDVTVIIKEMLDKIEKKPTKNQLDEFYSKLDDVVDLRWAESDFMYYKKDEDFPKKRFKFSDMSSNEIKLYVGLILDDILDDMMSKTEEFKYHLSLCNLMMRAVEEIPIEILKHESTINVICERLSKNSLVSRDSIDKITLGKVLETWDKCLCSCKDSIDKIRPAHVDIEWDDKEAPFRKMIEKILEKVFATGLDIIVFHK